MRLSGVDFDALDALAASLMEGRKAHPLREAGFIYWHGKRTAVSVLALRKKVTDDSTHDDALRMAAMFHDVGKGIEPHAASGAALAAEFLKPHLTPEMLTEVAMLIREHTNHQSRDLFAQILQDADALDHFGAIEIGLSFQYGAYSEEGMRATLAWYRDEYDPYIERTHKRLNLDISHKILDEKAAFTRAFVKRLEAEWAGEYHV